MTIKYGFELEGFARDANGVETIPPKAWPSDGFPGLIEIRTSGGNTLTQAYANILEGILSLKSVEGYFTDFTLHEATFTGKQLAILRKDRTFEKEFLEVSNLYGKEPRNLKGKTLASFQINITNTLCAESKDHNIVDGKIKITHYPTRYGLLDVGRIVRQLDQAFAAEIKNSNRQPGMYAIKDGYRLEYRSLPNTVFTGNMNSAALLLEKIKKAVEE